MGKGSPESTVVQTDLPEYVQPYFEDLLDRAGVESRREYIPYEGARIAPTSGDWNDSAQMTRDIAGQGIAGLEGARQSMVGGMNATADLVGGAQAGDYNTGYGFEGYGYQGPGSYLGNTVSQYMSPYMQNVVARQHGDALQNFNRQRGAREADAVKAGAFGGSRHGVQEYLAEEGLLDRMDDISAQGYQSAFEQGSDMFDRDRMARLGVDQLQGANDMWAQESQSGELARLQDARAREAAMLREFQLGGIESGAQQAESYANLGLMGGEFDRQSAADMQSLGEYMTARDQAGYDLTYEDFIRQRDYPREQLNYFSSILRGVPVSPSTETTRMLANNPLADIAGAGLSALGLYNSVG